MQAHEHPLSIIFIHDMALARDTMSYAFSHGAAEILFRAYPSSTIEDIPADLEPTVVLLSSTVQFIGGCHPVLVVQSYWPDAAVVLLGAVETADQVRNAINAGVRGWINEDASFPKLLNIIKVVADAGNVFDDEAHLCFHEWSGSPSADAEMFSGTELSPREHEIIQLVRAGRTNPEIADQLGIVNKTVEAHLTRIYRKRKGTSRLDLLN